MSSPLHHHEPLVPADQSPAELTARALVVGILLGMVFGGSSLYLVLKVGMTVSASIPVAVISVTLFRLLAKIGLRPATVLEHNIVQTAGSAGESIAFGVGVTMPAILILGFDLELSRVALVAVLGGLLGILMMIPLRRALIVQQHGILKYPEGTACAQVLRASESQDSGGAKTIFSAFSLAFLYAVAWKALKGWKEVPGMVFGKPLAAGSVAVEVAPELLGVGYIIGPRIAMTMAAGGVLAYLVLIPLIKFFGQAISGPLAPGTVPISTMGPSEIRSAYVLYIGAGAVAAGGLVSLVRSLPTIAHGIAGGIADLRAGAGMAASVLRTDRDLSMRFVVFGVCGLIGVILSASTLHMNWLGAILIVILGFLFVTVSSRLTGEIGSSSNPISGMTVATLLLTCLAFLGAGWTGPTYYVTALSVGAIVCIAASNGGTTSQDLKTGFLIGATPKLQQIAILVGAGASALVIGPILLELNESATVYVPRTELVQRHEITEDLKAPTAELAGQRALKGPQASHDTKTYTVWHKRNKDATGIAGQYLVDSAGVPQYLVDPGINGDASHKRPDPNNAAGIEVRKFDAPKATLMSYIIKGILDRKLPWDLVILGAMIALVLELCGVPSLAFAVGVYLPLSSSTPIMIGGLVRGWADRRQRKQLQQLSEEEFGAESDKSAGVMASSGLIAGGAIAGIVIALMAGVLDEVDNALHVWAKANNPFFEGTSSDLLSILPFALLTAWLAWVAGRRVAGLKAAAH
ncbi:MAG: oligopeptide transporter, OPT family [Myxococcales bacterium]|nr:oligopeptide transporter, OPT family [Myxococcales bacterium]